ncbi:Mediator of RNA polymerase II transcription subunit 10 [Mortierella alpina]|uniref:Mediator of RNA polymerase II transcription subunit 10 n=1 Tax=Mortierella alpina TaxID=64518 RepID=A0A9P6JBA5_MORAP|nr:Mediator of RNA polymerase II transcription subunit 10 [Mortierella alpina]
MSPPPAGALPAATPSSVPSTAQGPDSTSTQHIGTMDVSATQTEQTRQDLELKLQELIECLLELSITVYDFQNESGSIVHQKIQELITQLSDIEGFKDKLEMMVPWEVLSYIEDGKNPDLFSKTFVEAVAGENQFTNGKITALKASGSFGSLSFEAALSQNLESSFPEETGAYSAILQEVANGSVDPGVPESSHNS